MLHVFLFLIILLIKTLLMFIYHVILKHWLASVKLIQMFS